MPDKRLNRRLVEMASVMAGKPADSIPQAFDDWGGAKGAYRLIENKRMEPDLLRRAFREQTARDCQGQTTIIVVQDTTSLSFPRAHATKDLGPITNNDTPGLHLHSAVALNEDGLPIGLLHQHVWARPWKDGQGPENDRNAKSESAGKSAETGRFKETGNKAQGGQSAASGGSKRGKPIEQKESFKWVRGIREAREALAEGLAAELRPKVIWIADRESDIHDALAEANRPNESFVIRCNQNRAVITEQGEHARAHDYIRTVPPLGTMDVEIRRNGKRPARTARLELRAARLTLRPRCPYHRGRQPLTLNLVEARESAPPEGCEPVHWMLWTAEPASTPAQIRRVVGLYALRWRVEDYHQILKSGCRIEDVRFHTAERIALALALYGPIAVRILQLRDLSRLEPESPCTAVLGDTEWRVLHTQIHKRPPEPKAPPPTIRQAVLWIGRLGGHLGRKSDGMPGITTLWRGWRDLTRLVDFHAALHG